MLYYLDELFGTIKQHNNSQVEIANAEAEKAKYNAYEAEARAYEAETRAKENCIKYTSEVCKKMIEAGDSAEARQLFSDSIKYMSNNSKRLGGGN